MHTTFAIRQERNFQNSQTSQLRLLLITEPLKPIKRDNSQSASAMQRIVEIAFSIIFASALDQEREPDYSMRR